MLGDESIVSIQGKGSILFQCKNADQCLLTKVYYIPRLKSNIISLGQMTEESNRVKLVGSILKMFEKWSPGYELKTVTNRLYKIQMNNHQHLSETSIGIGGDKE